MSRDPFAHMRGTDAAALLDQVVEAIDATAGAVQTLRKSPTPDGAELLIYRFRALEELSRRITTTLMQEVAGC